MLCTAATVHHTVLFTTVFCWLRVVIVCANCGRRARALHGRMVGGWFFPFLVKFGTEANFFLFLFWVLFVHFLTLYFWIASRCSFMYFQPLLGLKVIDKTDFEDNWMKKIYSVSHQKRYILPLFVCVHWSQQWTKIPRQEGRLLSATFRLIFGITLEVNFSDLLEQNWSKLSFVIDLIFGLNEFPKGHLPSFAMTAYWSLSLYSAWFF